MRLTVIICLYEVDKFFLRECLLSLKNSTLCKISHEILIIDDGSTTDYKDTLEGFSVRYERIPHGGTLAARLFGIRKARGEHIVFVDADDTTSFNYHLPMLLRCESGAEIAIGEWAFHSSSSKYYCVGERKALLSLCEKSPLLAFLENRGKRHSFFVLWNKIFKREILLSAAREIEKLPLPSPFCFSEDTLISFFAFKYARRVAVCRGGYYFYRTHPSQSVGVDSSEKLIRQIEWMSFTLDACYGALPPKLRERGGVLIDEWRSLMARSHYAYARGLGRSDIYPFIKERYHQKHLEMPKGSDTRAYARVRLIPSNDTDIDSYLLSRYLSGEVVYAPKKARTYTQNALFSLKEIGATVKYRRTEGRIPREKIPFVKRIIFSPPVFALGKLLFPKGSKARAFFKRFI